ncbi:MAG: efflux RND transporter periplasmic adaptor subunit, partial [Chloroflexi bacterium]|nr:efflux RND transporter periplasmic adaptor subunit [Chloroflexota bacterium]
PCAQRDVPIRVAAIGMVRAYNVVTLKPQVAGIIVERLFTDGQPVARGDRLYRIDSRPFVASLEQAEAILARDKALAANARLDAQRKKDLQSRQASSPFEVDEAESIARAAEATVAADEAAVRDARLQVEYCEIRSPIDGYVGATLADAGNVVKANETELVVLRQVSPIYVELAVPQRYLPEVRRLMAGERLPVSARIPGADGDPVAGALAFVDNTVDEKTGTITLRGIFGNEDGRLWPGQYVEAAVTLGTRREALIVPARAVQAGQQGTYVYALNPDNTVALVPVTTGDSAGGQTVVSGDLAPGQPVVIEGHLRLRPGATVQVTKSDEATERRSDEGNT